ncbi:MAG: AMP-dependent synthetase [Bacteroidetes bacterium]|nr:MAG: AMP-dependent synthetase [Bacteroidota bacterium]
MLENAPFNIVDLFYEQARANPAKTALIDKDNHVISFGELEQQITETAQYFWHKGIRQGDRVLVFVPMSIDLYRTVLALFRIGATSVFLDEWVSMARLEVCCQVAQCKAFIGIWKARLIGYFSKELRKIPIWLGTGYRKVGKQASGQYDNFQLTHENDIALLTFTTGTTGTPKAAKRTHGFLKAQLEALVGKLEPRFDDVDMPVLPIVLLINLATGTPSVIANFKASKPNSLKPARLLAQIEQHQVNRIIASPFVIKALAQYALDKQLACPTLRKIFTGGAPVFPTEAQLYTKAFPTARIEIVYGSTEAEPISGCLAQDCHVDNPLQKEENTYKGLYVGEVASSATVKIIKITDSPIAVQSEAELEAMELPAGEVGEIIVAGKHVLREYFNNEEALLRNKIFIDGVCWHRTGDSGFWVEGWKGGRELYLMGRCNAIIRQGGKAFFPFVFEHYFQQIQGVVMGTILEAKGEIAACVELAYPAEKGTIETQILALPAPIDKIHFLAKMPRDLRHNSRIDYQALSKLL